MLRGLRTRPAPEKNHRGPPVAQQDENAAQVDSFGLDDDFLGRHQTELLSLGHSQLTAKRVADLAQRGEM